jgi:DNA-3-methyladenine glycosylase
MKTLTADFYARPVLEVAPELIGCTVVHGATSGMIVETEAYHESEPACHAFVGVTARTGVLFGAPGQAYVYRSYGIHAMLNAVCEPEGIGAAVLVRALAPRRGIELMRARRARPGEDPARLRDVELCAGPGRLTQALGIGLELNDTSLLDGAVRILARDRSWGTPEIVSGPRVGITKAAELPWRFCLLGDENVSRPWPWRRPRAAAPALSRSG